jgi:hypothetical protein
MIGLENILEGACTNCRSLSEQLFCMWKPEFTSTIFPFIQVLVPLIGWCPEQLPNQPTPYTSTVYYVCFRQINEHNLHVTALEKVTP